MNPDHVEKASVNPAATVIAKAKKPKVKPVYKSYAHQVRKELGFSQVEFWPRFAVTQSAGSRFENGRKLPRPLALLLTAALEGKITMDPKSEFAKSKILKRFSEAKGSTK